MFYLFVDKNRFHVLKQNLTRKALLVSLKRCGLTDGKRLVTARENAKIFRTQGTWDNFEVDNWKHENWLDVDPVLPRYLAWTSQCSWSRCLSRKNSKYPGITAQKSCLRDILEKLDGSLDFIGEYQVGFEGLSLSLRGNDRPRFLLKVITWEFTVSSFTADGGSCVSHMTSLPPEFLAILSTMSAFDMSLKHKRHLLPRPYQLECHSPCHPCRHLLSHICSHKTDVWNTKTVRTWYWKVF